MYQAAVKLRNKPAFQNNRLEYCVVNDDIFSYSRKDGSQVYIIAINAGKDTAAVDLSTCVDSQTAAVVLVTPAISKDLLAGQVIDITHLVLAPGDGIALRVEDMFSRNEL